MLYLGIIVILRYFVAMWLCVEVIVKSSAYDIILIFTGFVGVSFRFVGVSPCGRGALWEWGGTSGVCGVLYPRPRPWVGSFVPPLGISYSY